MPRPRAESPTAVVLVKLGGSLITDKHRPETARRQVIERLARELAKARVEAVQAIVLGHGSGSFGHTAAAEHRLTSGLTTPRQLAGVSATQAAAARLHRLVLEALAAAGATPFSLAPSSYLVTHHGRPNNLAVDPLAGALAAGLLPVTYGDVVMDSGQGVAIASTETVLTAVARRLAQRGYRLVRALWAGETAGLLDARGQTVPSLDAAALARAIREASGAAGLDVTGGIRHRLEATRVLARLGVPSLLFDGRVPGALTRALAGEEVEGTRVEAAG